MQLTVCSLNGPSTWHHRQPLPSSWGHTLELAALLPCCSGLAPAQFLQMLEPTIAKRTCQTRYLCESENASPKLIQMIGRKSTTTKIRAKKHESITYRTGMWQCNKLRRKRRCHIGYDGRGRKKNKARKMGNTSHKWNTGNEVKDNPFLGDLSGFDPKELASGSLEEWHEK